MVIAGFDLHTLQPGQWVKFVSPSLDASLDPQERALYENNEEIYLIFSRSKADQPNPACCFLVDTHLKVHKLVLNGSFDGIKLNLENQIKMLGPNPNAESTNCSNAAKLAITKAAVARAATRYIERNKEYFEIHPSEFFQLLPLGKRGRPSDPNSPGVEDVAAAGSLASPMKRTRSFEVVYGLNGVCSHITGDY